jgi:small subunit ribosomal protein S14
VRVRNRCAVTGRPRGVYSFCRLSRHMFRKLASFGLLNGIKKSSW